MPEEGSGPLSSCHQHSTLESCPRGRRGREARGRDPGWASVDKGSLREAWRCKCCRGGRDGSPGAGFSLPASLLQPPTPGTISLCTHRTPGLPPSPATKSPLGGEEAATGIRAEETQEGAAALDVGVPVPATQRVPRATCLPAPSLLLGIKLSTSSVAQRPRAAVTLPTSLTGPSAPWAHILCLRWSFHCPHPTTVFGSPSLQGMSMLGSGGHQGPSCLWRVGEDSYAHLCPQIPMPSLLLPPSHPSPPPPPPPAVIPQPFNLQPGFCPQGPRFPPGPSCWGPCRAHSPASVPRQRAAQPFPRSSTEKLMLGEAGILARGICGPSFHLLHPPPPTPSFCSGHMVCIRSR
ncbi:uncharacterized protein LOC130849649 [Hippopotamus amphibius kiboko]|uniref:uncharacterized protein LOC130849649 n=1 Tax=Hippopotamus amphibius kiboko TaxID=575201 RepID=UPI0025964832|nr:uncharacterized protein LOC130849649 [Hippopotamus amphibius kiboko]XP_057584676.1 uncharacterized protein LOC130849649 [Hippopotamus amphibius kiboko]